MKNLVVGAGLTGAVIAERLASKLREEVVVIEKMPYVGGMHHDYIDKESGTLVQIKHVNTLHTDNKYIWDYVNSFSKLYENFQCASISVQGRPVGYPLNLSLLHEIFPECLGKTMEEKLIKKFGFNKQVTLAEMHKNIDEDMKFLSEFIYENVFKPYNMKMWGVSAEALPDCANTYMPFNIDFDKRYYKDKYQGTPIKGWTDLIENLLKHKNIKLKLNTEFSDINPKKFDRIFFTGSIDEYFDYKYGELPYRSVNTRLETYDCKQATETSCCIFPYNYDFLNTYEYMKFQPNSINTAIVGFETFEQFELGKNDRFYPIKIPQSNEIYNKYVEEAKDLQNVYFAGRLGEFKFYESDELITRAFEMVASIMMSKEQEFVQDEKEKFEVTDSENE